MYTQEFYSHTAEYSDRSAQVVLSIVHRILAPTSVIDYGCARGHWLRMWHSLGTAEIWGYDGPHVQLATLVIPADCFHRADLSDPPRAPRRFGLSMCLEVAEHLPATSAPALIDALCEAAPAVLFSAAFPGQGGNGHISERPLADWARDFVSRGYVPIDLVRRAVIGDERVAPWYRANLVLYVQETHFSSLPPLAQAFRCEPDALPLLTPLGLRARAVFLRPLPAAVVTRLSDLNERLRARFT